MCNNTFTIFTIILIDANIAAHDKFSVLTARLSNTSQWTFHAINSWSSLPLSVVFYSVWRRIYSVIVSRDGFIVVDFYG